MSSRQDAPRHTLFRACLIVSVCAAWSGGAVAATLTQYPDEAALRAALGGNVVVVSEDFDGFAPGTEITTQVAGVRFSSPNAGTPGYVAIHAFATPASTSEPNILYGGFVEESPVQQIIVMEFPTPAQAVGFQFTGQYPVATDVTLTFDFTSGPSATRVITDVDGNNHPAEFFGVTSDTPITRLTLASGDQSGGGLFEQYGGVDDLVLAIHDTLAPICTGRPVTVDGVLGINGAGRDDRAGDTGVASVLLSEGATNLALTIDPVFTPGDPTVSFRVTQADTGLDATGRALVTDGAGNSCSLCLNFKFVPEGPTVAEVLCCADGIVFQVSNDNETPPGTSVCVASPFTEDEPAPPAGYEPSPAADPFPCQVLTIDSPISGLTEMVYKKDGTFDPRLRLLYSRSPDDGVTFPPFSDVTESVEEIANVIPDPTRVGGKPEWSVVKVACAIQAEICNGLDDDGDGEVDDGLPVTDLGVDFDADGFFLCPPAGLAADCNDQIALINPEAAERCNGLDDDCDAVIDDGNPGGGEACAVADLPGACAVGATACEGSKIVCTQTVFPSDETCDGLDNDCDGSTDEGFPGVGESCSAGVGACLVTGSVVCDSGGTGTVCDAVPGTPSEEVACDGVDNDCDGTTDEAFVFGGYLQPVNADGSSIFKMGSTIPFKFRLADCAGQNVVTSTPPTIEILLYQDGIVGTVLEANSSGKANDGDQYRYDAKANQYIYNLSTKTLVASKSYTVRTHLPDGTSHDVIVSIK